MAWFDRDGSWLGVCSLLFFGGISFLSPLVRVVAQILWHCHYNAYQVLHLVCKTTSEALCDAAAAGVTAYDVVDDCCSVVETNGNKSNFSSSLNLDEIFSFFCFHDNSHLEP